MKLKQILSEIKLIPQNRILLKKDDDDYYFDIENRLYPVWSEELIRGTVVFDELESPTLSNFLNMKKIPYEKLPQNHDHKISIIKIDAKYFITPDKINEHQEKRYLINYQYYNKLLDISNQYKTKYIKKVLDSIHNNQNDMATQRQYDLLKKFADGYGDNDKYPYSTKN
jgi:hypothetical protein